MDIVILFMFGIASEFPPAMSKHLPVFFLLFQKGHEFSTAGQCINRERIS